MQPVRTPIGIYILSAGFTALAILSVVVFFRVPVLPWWFCVIWVMLCALISLGLAFRVNLARVMAILLLVFALAWDAIPVFLHVIGYANGRMPVVAMAIRISLVMWTLSFLLNRQVRAAFMPPSLPDTPADSAGCGDVVLAGDPNEEAPKH